MYRIVKSYCTFGLLLFITMICSRCGSKVEEKQPNILFCIADDVSFIHTSIQGTAEISTPNFDRVASQGVLFNNAYCNASSCAPSRASILTGRNIWELEEGGLLFGGLPKKFPTFPSLLRQHGYITGYSGKGYMPANRKEPYQEQPLAPEYNKLKNKVPQFMSNKDYSGNFEEFLSEKDHDKPFFFWYGSHEAHRKYKSGIGVESGKDISKIKVPGFLPDNDLVRSDIADYYYEIEWFDDHLGRMIKSLEAVGELENTIIIVTADNGMPFPRAKSTCYDYGTHMPLAICWGKKIKGGAKVDDFISFTDFSPTLLEALGLEAPEGTTGNSFLDVLLSGKSGQVDANRDKVFTALERHTYCRPDGMPYPIRTIRKGDWLYIENFEPDRWPAGDADFKSPHQGIYGDIDASPTRTYLIENKEDDSIKYYSNLSISKHPKVELYNVKEDPYNLYNLALEEKYIERCKALKSELFNYLKETNDPRMDGKSPWDNYPYFFNGFEEKHLKAIGQRDNN
ncbi:sulfatase family protein [Seonamhaeicola maritimus]|uniref:Sulfatase n=1 Tax=Seonamhaeicola maritimus TaxID=2591822 RepID=A0A5C7GJ40_9FLAO|nr:sulfatase [Seonamhaeicola maritimus]TXG38388.1 sulfatase [Seonamhaeicola maritimus]